MPFGCGSGSRSQFFIRQPLIRSPAIVDGILGCLKEGIPMALIQITDLTFTYPGSFDPVFEHVSFQLDTIGGSA